MSRIVKGFYRYCELMLGAGIVLCLAALPLTYATADDCGEDCSESCYSVTQDYAFGECEECKPATCRGDCTPLCGGSSTGVCGEAEVAFTVKSYDTDSGSGSCSAGCYPATCEGSHESTSFSGKTCQ
jgi:hypothetical protein